MDDQKGSYIICNIKKSVPELIKKVAIRLSRESLTMTETQEKKFCSIINNELLIDAYKELVLLKPRSKLLDVISNEQFIERVFSLLISHVVGRRIESTPRQITDNREALKSKLKLVSTELQNAGMDFNIYELLDAAENNPFLNEDRKYLLSQFNKGAAKIDHFKTLFSPPKFSELVQGLINELSGCSPMKAISQDEKTPNIGYNLYKSSDQDKVLERELLFIFDSFHGKIPSCAWDFHSVIFNGKYDKASSLRDYRRWKKSFNR